MSKREDIGEDIILVGKRPAVNYAAAASAVLAKIGRVTLKARGRWISTAVSAGEIVRRRGNDVVVENIAIGDEPFKGDDGRERRVSTIEITLARKNAEQTAGREAVEAKPVTAKKGKQG
jgi:DNA-binding protein Alba